MNRYVTREFGVGLVVLSFCLPAPSRTAADVPFVRGDTNADGEMSIGDFWLPVEVDGVRTWDLDFPCDDAADTNDDGEINITDAIYLLNFLFLGGAATAPPGPWEPPGFDPSPDDLTCDAYDPQPVAPTDDFMLGIEGPGQIDGCTAGQYVTREYTCTLSQPGPGPGAHGWSIGIVADSALISAITTAGTLAAPVAGGGLQKGGFEKTELTTRAEAGSACEGMSGAVSAVVLSFLEPVALDPSVVSSIAKITVEAPLPVGEWERTATIRYADGCQGAGQPVANIVTRENRAWKPTLGARNVQLQLVPGCGCASAGNNVGFSAVAITGPGDLSTVLGTNGAGGTILARAPAGSTARAQAFVNVVSHRGDFGGAGVQGWSLAVALSGEATIVGATTQGTTAAAVPGGLRDDGYEKTEIVDPAMEPSSGSLHGLGPQGQGAVSTVVLSFSEPVTLLPDGVESVLRLTVALDTAAGDPTARLFFRSGLQGSMGPVSNVVTIAGATLGFCNLHDADVTIACCAAPAAFIRGNANADGALDLSDPVATLGYLFLGGTAVPCLDAADANDSGIVDLSDAIYTLSFLFLGGPEPPAPFGACEVDPTEDDLDCETYEACD